MNYYLHNVPGRMRIKIPLIQYQPYRAEAVQAMFMDLGGIDRISVNIVTGSIVIYYDPRRVRPDQLLNVLTENNLFDKSQASRYHKNIHKSVTNASERIAKVVFGWTVGRILDANGMSFLSALI